MKNISIILLAIVVLTGTSCGTKRDNQNDSDKQYWTFTYLKAKPTRKAELKSFLIKNWFKMDSIAVAQGLFSDYQLYENETDGDWDYIVAVEYFNTERYEKIAEEFEAIRSNHKTVKIDGMDFKELGEFVKSESVIRDN